MTEVNNEIKEKFQKAENLRFSNKFEGMILSLTTVKSQARKFSKYAAVKNL